MNFKIKIYLIVFIPLIIGILLLEVISAIALLKTVPSWLDKISLIQVNLYKQSISLFSQSINFQMRNNFKKVIFMQIPLFSGKSCYWISTLLKKFRPK